MHSHLPTYLLLNPIESLFQTGIVLNVLPELKQSDLIAFD